MNTTPPVAPQRPSRILSILCTALLLSIIGICTNFYFTLQHLQEKQQQQVGDGIHVESYGFDLSNCKVDLESIAASGLPKDGPEILDYPEWITADAVEAIRKEIRGKYQVSGDKVVGLHLNGDIRAYPIRVLQWHEVINDVVGDIPVAVTYSPLSDSVVVFDRRVEGETLEFGVSGLLYNSTLLMYDRRNDPHRESLWSQLQFRAVSGRAADENHTLHVLPSTLTRWDDWKTRYPDTKIIKPDLKKIRQYQSDPYGPYHSMDNLNHPVSPLPKHEEYNNKTKFIILQYQGKEYPIPYPEIQSSVDTASIASFPLDGLNIPIHYTRVPELCQVLWDRLPPDVELGVAYAYHFAWFSHHPQKGYQSVSGF